MDICSHICLHNLSNFCTHTFIVQGQLVQSQTREKQSYFKHIFLIQSCLKYRFLCVRICIARQKNSICRFLHKKTGVNLRGCYGILISGSAIVFLNSSRTGEVYSMNCLDPPPLNLGVLWFRYCPRWHTALSQWGDTRSALLSQFCPPLRFRNQVPTFAVRETDVSRTANVGGWLRKRNDGQRWV